LIAKTVDITRFFHKSYKNTRTKKITTRLGGDFFGLGR